MEISITLKFADQRLQTTSLGKFRVYRLGLGLGLGLGVG